jgi:hypothetical protein
VNGAAREEEPGSDEAEKGWARNLGRFDDGEGSVDAHEGFTVLEDIQHCRVGDGPLADYGGCEAPVFTEDQDGGESDAEQPE